MGVPARHEFTTCRDQMTIRCVSYYFASFYREYYLVFTNDALAKVILPPRFEHELSAWERGKRAVWTSYDPQERMDAVLGAPDLDENGIKSSIEHRYRPKAFDNALPAALIVGIIGAPIALVQIPERVAHSRDIASLAARFDPYRVRLGMTVGEVDQMFAEPRLSERAEDGSETRYYGSTKLGLRNRLLWLSVVFKDEKVTMVCSDAFFNYHKLENSEKGNGKR